MPRLDRGIQEGIFTTEITEFTEGKSVFSILTGLMRLISRDFVCIPHTVMSVYDVAGPAELGASL
jgi:hypothetical protein